MVRYYEDIETDETRELGSFSVSEREIMRFARMYDPLPFHLTPGGITDSVFDDTVASGLQTLSLANRQLVDEFLSDVALLGGRGLTKLDLLKPVYPDELHTVSMTVANKERLSEHPERGDVQLELRVTDPEGQLVMVAGPQLIVQRKLAD